MAKTVYAWRPGTSVKGIKAQMAGEELAKIEATNGGQLTPAVVVDAAKPVSAPLHPAFTWDDQLAADLHRLNEARNLIRCVCILPVSKRDEPQLPVVAYVHVPKAKEPVYMAPKRALSQAETRSLVVWEALRHMAGLELRYGQFTELKEIFDAIRGVKQRLETRPNADAA